jgi:hypothetical protein
MQSAAMALITGREAGGVAAADALVVGDARASAEERLHVYAHMYRARIIEALESQFPRLAKLVGADPFAELSAAYIREEPSRHPSLRYVGERVPAWLDARRPQSPELAGLARLEWARADVFDLIDEPTLTVDGLRAWPMDRFGELPLQLVAAHRLVTAHPGTARRWDAAGGDPADREEAAGTGLASESLLVWREGTAVYHRLVEESERAALELASGGTRFGVICETLLASHGEQTAVAQAYAWMSTWLADGLLLRPA